MFSPEQEQEILIALVERRKGLSDWSDEMEEPEIDLQVNEHIEIIESVIDILEGKRVR